MKCAARQVTLTQSNALNRMTPFPHGREIEWQMTWSIGTTSKAGHIFNNHKLAPNVGWDKKGSKTASWGNWAYRSMIMKKSIVFTFKPEGTETMCWITPGAMTSPEVKQKKTLQSRLDSTQVVIETLPRTHLEWWVITSGSEMLKSSRYIDLRALRARLDKAVHHGCHCWQVSNGATCLSNCEDMAPASGLQDRSFIAWSRIGRNLFTTGMSSCWRSSDLKFADAQNISSMVSSSSPILVVSHSKQNNINRINSPNLSLVLVLWSIPIILSNANIHQLCMGPKRRRNCPIWRAAWWFGRQEIFGYKSLRVLR